ncbi:Threonine aldolase [Methylobacterium sp. 4-46]|uniref:threonine aldolase family protein n=1 Tax=unclassified Methylobacterium TaxID=2615210 RepID=UPI000165C8ED|nr:MULTISPECIES: beta-eliminating lyase-related protein [Methylobacterium]ACA16299.1 Threonine aldolase [Methylobacterium sp. 4-46]WFT82007.1 beta-eliminating lyase-related protein [Methylobacterium nodulans]
MNFASDNVTGASAPILDALVRANAGPMPAYGADPLTAGLRDRFRALFDHPDLVIFPVATGTAANAIALAAMVPPYGLCLCHEEAHVMGDECGAPEFFTHGAKLAGLPGTGSKIDPAALEATLAAMPRHVKQMPARALTLSQATESGLVYGPDEVARLSGLAHRHGLAVHMDGARFANAVAALGCSPAEVTWRAGVDILSFGASKNGALAAEAIVVFRPDLAETIEYRRKRAGHLLSKGRLLAAQLHAYLEGDHWLANAANANRMAARLGRGLAAIPGVRLAWPVAANEVFPILPAHLERGLKEGGAVFYGWHSTSLPPGEAVREDERFARLITAFSTTEAEVDAFLALARACA